MMKMRMIPNNKFDIYIYNFLFNNNTIMPLRSGQEYLKKEYLKKIDNSDNQSLKLNSRQYIVNIDFDDSSKEWRKNKIHLGGGLFKYKN